MSLYPLKYKTTKLLFLALLTMQFAFGQGRIATFSTHSNSLKFIENKQQWDARIRYKTGFTGNYIFLEKDRFTYLQIDNQGKKMHPHNEFQAGELIKGHAFNQRFIGANPNVTISGNDTFPEYYNYFIGKDSSKWSQHVNLYASVNYKNLYDGIAMKVYSKGTSLKYDFIVAPNADYHQIQIQYEATDRVSLDEFGNLNIQTSVGKIIEQAPICYQIIAGKITTVPSHFKLRHQVLQFEIGNYDHSLPLVIDPTLIFCTYTGSTDDNWGTSATYDNAGNLYAAGIVVGNGYPTTLGAFQTLYGGGTGTNSATWNPYYGDISISKFNTTGTGLIYSSFLGGTNNDYPNSLIVTPANELIVFGRSYSNDYPVTAGAYDVTYAGGADMVITKFNASGSALIGSTYMGGSLNDGVNYSDNENVLGSLKRNYGDDARGEVNLDNAGNIFIASCTFSSDFPTSIGCYQAVFGGGTEDGVVCKFNPGLTGLIYSTYLGGSLNDACYSIDIDQSNNSLYVCGGTESANFPTTPGVMHTTAIGGIDGFLTHFNATGTALIASTFIGTSLYDQCYFVKLDKNRQPYIMGQTTGNAYPVSASVYTNPNSGQFITKMNPNLSGVAKSTVIGNGNGAPNLSPTAFTVDICDNVYFAGWGGTFLGLSPGSLANMPLTANAIQSTTDQAAQSDFYLAVLNRNFQQLTFGSYYGGNGSLEHVDGGTSRFDNNGYIYGAICAGCITNDSYLAATPGAWSATNNSTNCNLAAYKIAIPFPYLSATAAAAPDTFGCGPFTVQFTQVTNAAHYSWTFGDPGSGILNTSILAAPTHTFNNAGTYQVMLVVIDSSFCNITDTAYLTVLVTNDTIKSFVIANDSIVCPNQIVSFQAGGQFGQTYHWDFGDLTTSTLQNPTHSYTTPNSYLVTLIVNNPFTCNKSDTSYLTVQVVATSVSDTFTVNTTHGCPPLSVHFNGTVTNATSYSWNFGDGTPSFSGSLNVTHTYANAGTYTATLYAFNSLACNPVDSFSIVITSAVTNVTANAQSISPVGCTPYTAQFQNLSTNATNYQWNFGDPLSGALNSSTLSTPSHLYNTSGVFTVFLIASDSFTCNKHDTIQFQLAVDTVHVIAAFTASPITGCVPLNVNFTNNSWHALSYQWNFGDGSAVSTQTNPAHTYIDTLSYWVTLIANDSTTCNLADTATVLIDPYYTYVDAKFSIVDTMACRSLDLSIMNQTTGATAYQWDLGNSQTSTLFQPTYTYSTPGAYLITLIATNPSYCKPADTVSHGVHVFLEPTASFSASPFIWKPDSFFSFINHSADATVYDWYIDGVYIGSNESYQQSFHKLGYHKICLVAKNANGCIDSICKEVYVDVTPSIGVPNAFSPDGDGINDILFVYGLGIETIDFRIYNRWGQLVFETTDRNKGWDGTFKGVPQEMEVYAYVVSATFITGTSQSLKGNVTLVR